MHRTMIVAAMAVSALAPAKAQTIRPVGEARLRYEGVTQAALPERSDALTFRVHAGAEARQGPFALLIEGEATIPVAGLYNDGLNGRTERPLIVDPGNLQLNRAQLRYASGALALTGGRQRIEILDQRFVGSAPFRQNDQTFDAMRIQWGRNDGPTIDLSYAWQALGVNGARGRGARQDAVSGGNLFAVAGVPTPAGTASAFAIIVDQDESIVQGFRLSSASLGLRLAGTRPVGDDLTLSWAGSLARQRDHGRNPNRYAAGYGLAEATLAAKGLSTTVGYEVLGADDGRALTSFQTPLSSLFKFQGWTDTFIPTPPDGVRDLYTGVGYRWRLGSVPIAVNGNWHRLESDRLVRHYGDVWNLLTTAQVGKTLLAFRYAHYRANRFGSDTHKLWLSADWVL